ncbi:hypothetical protein FDP41_000560 [Naegleria fowleri]|uniref:TATA-binding protein-associated factor 172 n=1 Tax=Naegleria fowleri TaxID=5763 RepID=A0A6A5CBK9_NAEFO|nr:uncharacterized protein FDP41_000560 [Naegleria fowleri]KAF0984661.1 hypothetical protein FDP41_000560 [Naegleria fowleri]CAG4715299.1 unnamed protein product [Naegleria fowleri]
MTSRLDRLLNLLDSGSLAVRSAAAKQIAEATKYHQAEIPSVLFKVAHLLRSPSWETRTAAGEAISAIAQTVPLYNRDRVLDSYTLPTSTTLQVKKEEEQTIITTPRYQEKVQEETQLQHEKFSFRSFDIRHVLQHGVPLFASNVVDEEQKLKHLKPKERLAFHKRQVYGRLGYLPDEKEELLIFSSDYQQQQQQPSSSLNDQDVSMSEGAAASSNEPLSARERREKFIQKQNIKKQQQQASASSFAEEQQQEIMDDVSRKAKKMKTLVTEQPQAENMVVIESTLDMTSDIVEYERWPFHYLTDKLLADLFNSSWVIRHGAAIGLREILKVPEQIQSAGKSIFCTEDLSVVNARWLEDCCIRILCLFALDKFTDFLSDQVISPIPETCAQILGLIFKYINTSAVKTIVSNLVLLMEPQNEWKVRHNALLGLKYAVALRSHEIDELFPMVLPAVIQCLSDETGSSNISAEDVKAVAADCLVPIAEHVMKLNNQYVTGIFSILWNSLLEMDDLSSSTASVMTLLAKLYSIPQKSKIILEEKLHILVPRLYPYMRHNILSVRVSALETIMELIQATNVAPNSWVLKGSILSHLVALIFQNLILDSKESVIEKTLAVWQVMVSKVPQQWLCPVVSRYIGTWCSLMSTPIGHNFDIALLTLPEEIYNTLTQNRWSSMTHDTLKRKLDGTKPEQDQSMDGQTFSMRMSISELEEFTQLRMATSKAIAIFASSVEDPNNLSELMNTLDFLLKSSWSIHRETAGLLLQNIFQYSEQHGKKFTIPEPLVQLLLQIVQTTVYTYSSTEIQHYFTNFVSECNILLHYYARFGLDVSSFYSQTAEGVPALNMSVSIAQDLTSRYYEYYAQNLADNTPLLQELEMIVNRVKTASDIYVNNWNIMKNRALSILSCAIIYNGDISAGKELLSPLMVILLPSIETQGSSITLQQLFCKSLAKLLFICKDFATTKSPNPAITKKVLELLCKTMPQQLVVHKALEKENQKEPIVEEESEKQKKGRKKKGAIKEDEINEIKDAVSQVNGLSSKEDPLLIAQRGAAMTLCEIAKIFEEQIFDQLEPLRVQSIDIILQKFHPSTLAPKAAPSLPSATPTLTEEKVIVNALHIFRTIAPSITSKLYGLLVEIMKAIIQNYVTHPDIDIRKHAALTISEICYYVEHDALIVLVKELLPLLANPTNVASRRGAALTIYSFLSRLEMKSLPAVAFLAVPLLKRMSDQDDVTREIASNCFGTVIKLLPLEKSSAPLQGLEQQLEEEHKFIDQLLDNTKVEPFDIPIKINAELRQYQKDGVSWLAFLNKYNLHGILCDDMGLGKTLQTICMINSDIHMRKIQYQQTRNPEFVHLPSLVVCPPTLLGHWGYEINKFCPDLTALQYLGSVSQRRAWRAEFHKYDIVILSYDVLRNDIKEIVAAQNNWNYCILDEGHIIKNKKTQITKAVKQIKANHRLILSGTPIQNNVLELWSLFDFLMPGFLGTEKEFNAKYSKPIQASRDAKANSKEQAAGTLALQSLHRQVLPFLLRRVKEDVLHDLPEKIIQDYYCELSPIQSKMYEYFAKKEKSKVSQELQSQQEEKKPKDISENSHVFKALKYLRKLCNHPCLVLEPDHPMYQSVTQEIKQQGMELTDVNLSPKLLSLKQLLNDCGIGLPAEGNNAIESGSMNQHRVLIFCQMKQMLDIIQNELFAKYMPSVTYMRLDGDVETMKRHEVVQKFNSDPTIDVLLLTTKIGGLGLNLTGADTVIFVEHDWNPSNDLQAMDRAHRIGQKKVVNVYRLITKNTLEEKIMGLQKFKLNISKSVINSENSSLASMDTEQLVDLFNFSGGGEASSSGAPLEKPTKKSGLGQVLENMEEYDQEQQYQDFNLSNFVSSVSK